MSVQWTIPAWMWPLLLVVAAGAFVWTVLAYRRTRPLPGTGLRRVLVGLRTGALLLLVLGMAGPVVSRRFAQAEPAVLLVVVEDSGSMAIPDGRPGGVGGLPAQSRWERALAVAARLDSLFAGHEPPVQVVTMRGNGLEPPQKFGLDDAVIPAPGRHGTDLDALLKQTCGQLAGRPVGAVVLLSDGQQTGGPQDGAAVGSPRPGDGSGPGTGIGQDALPAPLVAVGLGDPRGPADRMIRDLRYPSRVHLGDDVQVEFAIVQRFVPTAGAATAEVRLEGPAGLLATRSVALQEDATPVSLSFRAGQDGLQVYRLSVSLLDNERFPDNNEASLAVTVARERARLLLLSPAPDWDTRFLAQAALGERRLALSVVYPAEAGFVFADSLTPWEAPTTAAQWGRWDGVVLASWAPAGRSVAGGPVPSLVPDWAALAQAVHEGLGLLVLPAGPDPRDGPTGGEPPPALAAVLPVQAQAWRWRTGDFHPALGAEAVGHPVLSQVTAEPGGGWGSLAALPPLRAVMAVRPTAEALVLLTAQPLGPAAADGGAPALLAVRGVGRGRTIWWGGRNLWELAFYEQPVVGTRDQEDQPGRRLLRNLLVWLAAGGQDSQLSFLGEAPVFQEGERIRLRAQWRDIRGQPVAERGVLLVIRPRTDAGAVPGAAGGPALRPQPERTFRMSPVALEPGVLAVDLPAQPPGLYTAQLVGEGEPQVEGPQADMVVTEHSIESTQVQQDQRRLQQLAARHDGTFLSDGAPGVLENLHQGLADLDWSGRTVDLRTRHEPGSGWPFLAGVVALLAAEWWLRRRHGLL